MKKAMMIALFAVMSFFVPPCVRSDDVITEEMCDQWLITQLNGLVGVYTDGLISHETLSEQVHDAAYVYQSCKAMIGQ